MQSRGDMVNRTSERAFNYIKEHKDDVFEVIVLLAGTNDTNSKNASASTDSIAQDLLKTAQDLFSKDSVRRVFICKIPPKLDNQMRDVKATEINEKVVESMEEMNTGNLFLIESVKKYKILIRTVYTSVKWAETSFSCNVKVFVQQN